MIEARVVAAGAVRCLGIDIFEIVGDRAARGARAVKVEAVEADPRRALGQLVVDA
jgi:hypothetical protein